MDNLSHTRILGLFKQDRRARSFIEEANQGKYRSHPDERSAEGIRIVHSANDGLGASDYQRPRCGTAGIPGEKPNTRALRDQVSRCGTGLGAGSTNDQYQSICSLVGRHFSSVGGQMSG